MIMDDAKKAMLGDCEAQQRLTEKGELLPCPWCGKSVSRVGTIAMRQSGLNGCGNQRRGNDYG